MNKFNRRQIVLGATVGFTFLSGCIGDETVSEPEPEPEPEFEILSHSISSNKFVQGKSVVDIETKILNNGGEGEEDITIKMSDKEVYSQTIHLVEGEEKEIVASEIETDQLDIGPIAYSVSTINDLSEETIYVASSDESEHEAAATLFKIGMSEKTPLAHIESEYSEINLDTNTVTVSYKNDLHSSEITSILHILSQVVENRDWWIGEFQFEYEGEFESYTGRWKADIEWIHEIIKDEDRRSDIAEKVEDTREHNIN